MLFNPSILPSCFLKNIIQYSCDIYLATSKFNCIDDTAPFKFDVPSPDDLVSNGLWSSRTGSKGILFLFYQSSIVM